MNIDELPYVPALGDGGTRRSTQLVVIHSTSNTASDEAEASFATHRPDKTSAHFYVDDDSAIRALPLDHIAYGCYPMGNSVSVQLELTGNPTPSDATMRQAAPVVAEVCRRFGIPIVKVTPEQMRMGLKGVCGHGDVTAAWNQGNHTDPGPWFRWGDFVRYVQEASGEPAPAPPPPSNVIAPPFPGTYYWLTSPMMHAAGIRVFQARLSVRGWRITVDGWFGGETDRVVRAFQREKRLVVDGIVGPFTWRALWESPITT